ncbi:MAG: DEAD/DEAH box helicase [Candidatus Bathyarchaeia archaeon]
MKFDELQISDEVKRALSDLGFDEMFPIQEEAIPPMLEGRDVIGQAKTGTGKTAAFGVPMIENLEDEKRVQALVIAPTRELALQINEDINSYARYTPIWSTPIYGGVSIGGQITKLRRYPQIVVGTPGRLIDHMKRGNLDFSDLRMLVLDEADRMLDMGFIEDIEYIIRRTPRNRQMSMWSATIDERTQYISKKYMNDATFINVSKDEIGVSTIEMKYLVVAPHEKYSTLKRLIDLWEIDRCLIFCRMRVTVDRLAGRMKRDGYDAEAIHGRLSQARREQVLDSFKEERVEFMIATEVAARGLDIQEVPYIINYDIPRDPNMYFHRVGRTARAGKSGNAVTLVTPMQEDELERIKAITSIPIEKISLPPSFLL